jgi:hypothetical protein
VVAIKLIHSYLSRDSEFVRRFRAEANALAKLRHPYIVQVYDFDQEGDTFYLVLEFVPGETLQARLKRSSETNRQMTMAEVFKVALDIGEAVQYAHERDIVHRDIKPANVMLNVHGDAILTDFGIVKIVGGTQHTATGAVLGTARYMSPEQIRGQRVDASSDIYSFGVMLFEMLGGRPPFDSDSAMSLMMMHINEPVPDVRRVRPEAPPGLVEIINKAMAKEVGQRYQSMAQLLTDLRRVQAGGSPVGTARARPAVVAPAPKDVNLTDLLESDMGYTDPAPRPRPAPAPAPARMSPGTITSPRKESQRTLYIASAVAILAVIAGLFLIFGSLGDDGDGQATEVAGVGASSPQATAVAGLAPTGEGSTLVPPVDTPEPEATATNPAAPTATNPPPPSATNPPPPTATNPPPPAATNPPPPAATNPPPPTATSPPPATQFAVQITGITVGNNRYVVSYETFGYTEAVPGRHVHFFFNTVAPDQAGVPGSGPWILYGGPRPFTGYSVADRPGAATQMCALVANDDHSVVSNTGNCMNLP